MSFSNKPSPVDQKDVKEIEAIVPAIARVVALIDLSRDLKQCIEAVSVLTLSLNESLAKIYDGITTGASLASLEESLAKINSEVNRMQSLKTKSSELGSNREYHM